MPGPLGRPLETVRPRSVGVQPDALQSTPCHERRHPMGTFVGDGHQHAGVRPDCSWQDERGSEGGGECDDDWGRRWLDGRRPTPAPPTRKMPFLQA